MTQKELKGMMVEEIVRLRKQLKAELNLRRLQPEGQLPAAIGPHVFFSRGVAHSSSAGSSEPLCKVCGEDKDYSAHSELTAGILGFHHFEPQAGCLHKPQPSPSSSSPGRGCDHGCRKHPTALHHMRDGLTRCTDKAEQG